MTVENEGYSNVAGGRSWKELDVRRVLELVRDEYWIM